MSTKKNDRMYTMAVISAVVSVIAIAGVTVLALCQLIIKGVDVLVSEGRVNGAYLALIFLAVLFITSLKFVYTHWKAQTSFIHISHHHYEVEPVNRRDGIFFED